MLKITIKIYNIWRYCLGWVWVQAKEGSKGSRGGVGRRSSLAQSVVSFPRVATTIFITFAMRGTQNLTASSLPHCLWLPFDFCQGSSSPTALMVSSLSLGHAELCLCLGRSRSYSAMQTMCVLKKIWIKKLSLWHFSHLFAQTKKIHLQHEPRSRCRTRCSLRMWSHSC